MTSAQNIANELLSSCIVSVSAQTVRNVLHSTGLKARTPRKKPYISEVNRKRRLEFAMKYKSKPPDFWKKVIFSDESKFEIFTSLSIRKKFGEKNKTALEPKNVLPTLKYGGGNVMVQGSFEVAPGNFDSISMSAGLRINEFERMVNCKMMIASFTQPFIRFPAVRNNSRSWFDP
ncbi:transposable element Tcb1 transposase [Trichonephila clavipes]|nr:transposable element Tcb1 transposase [Trichonephila clavipes]